MNSDLFKSAPQVVDDGLQALNLSDLEFRKFRQMIYELAGISLSDSKKPLVGGRLARRVREHRLATYNDYFQLLMHDRDELQVAVDLLTTNETYFFREPKHFDFLRDTILPALRQPGENRRGPLRFWSGACSSGEEPYTLAMVIAEQLGMPGKDKSRNDWEMVASDISTRVLAKARRGQYPLESAENIPRSLLQRYCFKGIGENSGTFLVDPALARQIRFTQVNLNGALPASLGQFDVIFLRNVMIYFDMATKAQVVERLLAHLRPGGHFIISHAESLNGVTDQLLTIKPSIYRKPAL